MKIPKGRVIEEFEGRPNALEYALSRHSTLDGYICVDMNGQKTDEGCLVMEGGQPIIAFYDGGEKLVGQKAYEQIRKDSREPHCQVSVHTDVKPALFKQYYQNCEL